MRRITVLYLVSTLRRAGPTAQLYNIISHLDRSRFEPVVLTLSPEPADSLRSMFTALGTRVRTLALPRWRSLIPGDWSGIISRAAGCEFDGYTMVHSQGIRADVISARFLTSVPRVSTVRNYPHHDYVMKFGAVLGKVMARRHLLAMRNMPSVVACSASLASLLEADSVTATVILNGVDRSSFSPADPDLRAAIRTELDLPPEQLTGVSVGALVRRKDPLTIIQAIRSRPELPLNILFVGDGELERTCHEAASGDPRIRFHGHTKDVLRYLRASDVLVSASLSEGLPNSVLEALCTGLHVVLSDIGPHREILERLPFAGKTFPVGHVEKLADALAGEVGQVRYFNHSEQARIAAELGAERMSAQYQALYATLAEEAVTA